MGILIWNSGNEQHRFIDCGTRGQAVSEILRRNERKRWRVIGLVEMVEWYGSSAPTPLAFFASDLDFSGFDAEYEELLSLLTAEELELIEQAADRRNKGLCARPCCVPRPVSRARPEEGL